MEEKQQNANGPNNIQGLPPTHEHLVVSDELLGFDDTILCDGHSRKTRVSQAMNCPGCFLICSDPSEMKVYLLTGTIPRLMRTKVKTGDTLAMIEPDVRNKWQLGNLQIQFVVGNYGEEDWEVVPNTSLIEDLGLGDRRVVGIRQGTSDKEPEIPQFVIPPASGNPVVADPNPDVCPYTFVMDGGTKRITLQFGPTETIQDAKDRLGKHINVDPEQITLFLAGKLLQETLILKRVCEPGQQILAL
jgi:hypothetical protein